MPSGPLSLHLLRQTIFHYGDQYLPRHWAMIATLFFDKIEEHSRQSSAVSTCRQSNKWYIIYEVTTEISFGSFISQQQLYRMSCVLILFRVKSVFRRWWVMPRLKLVLSIFNIRLLMRSIMRPSSFDIICRGAISCFILLWSVDE